MMLQMLMDICPIDTPFLKVHSHVEDNGINW